MNRKLLSSAICGVLLIAAAPLAQASSTAATPAGQQDQSAQRDAAQQKHKKEKPETLNAITVTPKFRS